MLTDRKTRYTAIEFVGKATGVKIKAATAKIIQRLQVPVHTMTSDNGTEFRKLEGEDFTNYYCNPNRPQERGSVENAIGLIRQYLKRSTEAAEISTKLLRDIEKKLNHRPKKILGYRTPYEKLHRINVAMAT